MSDQENLPAGADGHRDPSLQPTHPEEPVANPGFPEHRLRPTDVDPGMERRAERQVAGMFALAAVLALGFCVAYFAVEEDAIFLGMGASNLALGLSLGMSLLLIGIGAIQWARKLMGDHEIVEYRHSGASSESDREETLEAFKLGAEESGFGRRKLVRNTMLGAMAMLGLPAIVVLRDLGPLPGTQLESTVWRRGIRIVNDVDGLPIRPDSIVNGQLINAEPAVFFDQELPDGSVQPAEYEGIELNNEKAKAAVVVVRMLPDDITPAKGRESWGVDGILCYSKICTHVGCPISLWEQQTHKLLCPCHQSTFDLADNGKVLFGPAARSVPQLPIMVDDEGYLVAQSDFLEPVGPSYWERG
ncbi:MAG: Rieske (2Fe-2S) protein [Propionibacteriales bacterium]|nr:Rieske (2Fe-2S) protein [Propionibacteriales bacterium]